MVTDHAAHRVIHTHLVVQPVEAVQQVATIVIGVIHLTNELDLGVLLTDGLRGKAPELGRHHLRHIATEGIHTLGSPEEQYLRHLVPRVGNGVEVADASSIVVKAIVQFDSLVPVGLRRCIIEVVITRSLGRLLQVRLLLTLIQVEVRREALTWTIVEVVLRIETLLRVVIGTKIHHALWLADRVVLTGHMVGHEVDNHLQPSSMGTLHQLFKLLHALIDVDSQVGVNIIIIGDGVGRTSLTLHHSRMLARNTILAVVSLRSMTDNTRIPHMTNTHGSNVLQHLGGEVCHLTTTVFGNRAVPLAGDVTIAEKAGKYLINNDFIHVQRFVY